jgi:dTDP-4-amino-4,6-dideoxygalactose transaminase
MRKPVIPAQRYDFPDEDVDAVLERFGALLRSRGFLTMGRYGEELERRFAAYTGAPHAVAVSSGTAALEAILRALGVAGHEVVVPTNTFAATAFAVIHAGGQPVLADCGNDLSVDPDDVVRRLGPRTRAVVVVHIGGLISPSVLRLRQLCRGRGIPLVEDAAHAHGSRLEGMQAGTIGDAAAYSFFSTKVMTTGEGGMVVTDDPAIAEAAKLLRDQAKIAGHNLHEEVGDNWRMSEVHAILGLAQLARLDELIAGRRRVAGIYDEMLDGATERLRPLRIPRGAEPNYYKYVLFTSHPGLPEEIATRLRADHDLRLGGFVYDVPLHRQPVFERLGAGEVLPRADDLCRRHVCPPIYPSLTDEEARYVAECLLKAVS